MAGARVLVTGGGGFVGSAAVGALRAAGFETRAGVRRETPREGQARCDLDRPDQIRAALEGVDLVVHAAYGDVGQMSAQNAHLLAAMAERRVLNLVSLSSIAVYGDADGAVEEATPSRGALDAYATSKIACEAATRAWASANADRRALMLRPGIVYGTGSPFFVVKLAERIRLGAWAEFGPDGEGVAALIHVDDLAGMIVASAQRLLGAGRADFPPSLIVNAVGPETPSWNAYFQALAARIGAGPLARRERGAVARAQAIAIPAKIWKRLGLPGARAAALAPTRGEIAMFARRAHYATAAAEALGLRAGIGLAEGLARTQV